MGAIALEQVHKEFPGGTQALDGVDLAVEPGELMVLVGPSGCGKSTLLRTIAGLETVSSGRVLLAGRDITHTDPRDRDIAMVFQNYALYPHMTVSRNLGYGLRVRGVAKDEIARRVADVALALALEPLLERRPSALSGGQRQRVAIGRAMVREPAAFLMDEPLSNLDAQLRVEMRAELTRLHQRLGVTTVYVTHDQVEAMTLGERVAVMRGGAIEQIDRPQTLYEHPANLFVAAFIGSPRMNLVRATIEDDGVCFGGLRIPLDRGRRPAEPRDGGVILGVRPECFEDAAFATADLPRITVDVEVVEDLGADAYAFFSVAAERLENDDMRAAAEGERAAVRFDGRTSFVARIDPRSSAYVGARLELAVDPRRLHFFDPRTGRALETARPIPARTPSGTR